MSLLCAHVPVGDQETQHRTSERKSHDQFREEGRRQARAPTAQARGAAAARCRDRLVYATCSTLREENEDVVAAFADESFELEDTRRLLPGFWHDGFFVARWRRRSV